jgi:hypothetical protein
MKVETIFHDNLHQGWNYQSSDAGDEFQNLIAASITQTNSSTVKFSIDFIVSTTIMHENEMKIKEEKFLLLYLFLLLFRKIFRGKNNGRKWEKIWVWNFKRKRKAMWKLKKSEVERKRVCLRCGLEEEKRVC